MEIIWFKQNIHYYFNLVLVHWERFQENRNFEHKVVLLLFLFSLDTLLF